MKSLRARCALEFSGLALTLGQGGGQVGDRGRVAEADEADQLHHHQARLRQVYRFNTLSRHLVCIFNARAGITGAAYNASGSIDAT